MLVKNADTGEIVGMDYDAAVAAVTAGTHAFVNVDGDGKPKPEEGSSVDGPDSGAETRDEAERPVPLAPDGTISDIDDGSDTADSIEDAADAKAVPDVEIGAAAETGAPAVVVEAEGASRRGRR